MSYRETYKEWLDMARGDDLRDELNSIKDDDAQIKERFLQDMPFGTAGLRGLIGAGTTRMNRYTVGRATQGLAQFLKSRGKERGGMVIAYDSRNYSREFAKEAACIFAGNGIKTYIFKELTGVPELSFAVRHLKASGGVVITASHNPKDYNGYKVYAAYGGQLNPQDSLKVMEHIQSANVFSGIKRMAFEDGVAKGIIEEIGEEVDASYCENLILLCGSDEAADLKVVYTPLHGSGLRLVKRVLPAAGIRNLHIVSEQSEPDGDFPTVKSPNPEDALAMRMAVELAKNIKADIVIGTDPDADRMGAAVRENSGEYRMLTGNSIGCILIAYLLEERKRRKRLLPTDFIVKSFVSSNLADAIARDYGVKCHTVLTGFRFISELIARSEGTENEFVFGFEESCGFLAGNGSRDKDGVLASLLFCKAAQHYKDKGKGLLEVLDELYARYGYYLEEVKNVEFAGIDGMEKMLSIMSALREKNYESIGGISVAYKEDYQSGISIAADGTKTQIDMPRTNAIKYILKGGAWVCVRPSGTEPKIKIYIASCAPKERTAKKQIECLRGFFDTLL
ncbi:MAG: phospho-sugar mutase [Christensenellales bacterium]